MGSPQKPNIIIIKKENNNNNNNNNNSKFTSSTITASIASPQSAASIHVHQLDSSIFNYINSLSPIKPVKGTSVVQVFPGITSPPLAFTSPRVNTHRQPVDLKSSNCHLIPQSGLFQQDDTSNTTTGANLTASESSSVKNSEDAPSKVTDSMNPEGSMESNMFTAQDLEGNIPSRPKPVGNDGQNGGCLQSNICQSLESNASGDYISVQQYDQRVAQVGQSQLGKRRRLQFEAAQEKIVENEPGFQSPSNAAAKSDVLDSSSSQKIRSSSLSVSKPSGIGLHLNSIVNAMPMTFSIVGRKSSISISSQMQDYSQCPSMSSNSSLADNVSARSEDYTHETLQRNANPRMTIEYEDNFNQGILDSKQAERVDKFERSAPRKKRKKTESTSDGCKRCNCKKTKCLKLYCDCFAAGVYCAGPCSCQGCFNRPEYERTVLETRQQIESRNPLAFAPKVIHRVTQPPRTQTVEDGDHVPPLAGRHKRGCNCKKSMCLKKYCECYQANVGCADGCRCEGCQNIYGAKAVSGTSREMGMEAINETFNDLFDDKLKVGSIRSRSSLPEFHKPHNLTPQTPSFQHSNHGKDVSKARAFPGRYVPSPESECTFYPSYVTTPTSPKDTSSFDMIKETSNKNPEMVTFDQDIYPDIEYTDEFSPGDWSNSSRSQLLPPSSVSLSSLCYHDSSLTPVTLLGGAKSSFDIVDDDTPTILKDSSSIQPTKVLGTSPNKKRVSPPKLRLHEFGSSSLKSGRKFILKAVPSFPPLTPGNFNH